MESRIMIADQSIQYNSRSTIASPLFSILIPSWNNLPYLKLCVESIRKNSSFKHQIILHINEGGDGSLEWARTQDELDYTYSMENIGVCYALNLARSLARADFILYMNDDMFACPGWDQVLHDEIRAIGHPYFFLSATAIEPMDTNNPCALIMDCGKDIHGFSEEKLLLEYMRQPMQDWQGSTWPPNIVHKQVWDLVGGYSPEFSPGMYSDPDFSMKLWTLGVRLFKGCARSRVYHFGSKSVGRVNKNKGYYRFIEKWGMSSDTLTRNYLRRGEAYDGPLKIPQLSMALKLKNAFKRLQVAFRHH